MVIPLVDGMVVSRRALGKDLSGCRNYCDRDLKVPQLAQTIRFKVESDLKQMFLQSECSQRSKK